MENWIFSFIEENYPGHMKYDANLLRIGYIDIEVRSDTGFPVPDKAEKQITAITVFVGGKYVVFGCPPEGQTYKPHLKNVIYKEFRFEEDMIQSFLALWEMVKVDIVSGWNIEGFDIPYLVNRIKRLFGSKEANRLSPWKLIRSKTIPTYKSMEQETFDIYGINILDYMFLYKRFRGIPRESYRLGYIGHIELGMEKVDYKEYETLERLYLEDFQKFIEYNIRDVEILPKLDEELNLMQLSMNLAYTSKVNFQDIFKQTRLWDSIIFNYLKEGKGVIVPQRKKSIKTEAYAGAYVKDPIPGMYEYVITLDVTSMYPHLFMHYNIGPDTYVGKVNLTLADIIAGRDHGYGTRLKEKNLSMAANGTMYRKDIKGFSAELLETMFEERKLYKRKMLDAQAELEKLDKTDPKRKELKTTIATYKILQQVKKECLNSYYGAFGNPVFRFYEVDQAEAITISGQHAIQWAERKVNEFLNKILGTTNKAYVVYADTDSVHVCLDKLVKKFNLTDRDTIVKFIDKFVESKLQPYLDVSFEEMHEYMNSFAQKIYMKREKIADKAIWTSKKRYIFNVLADEATVLKEPKVSITGIEAIRSSTPEVCRKALEKCIWTIMNKSEKEMQKFIDDFWNKFKTLPFEDIASPTSVNNLEEYRDRNTLYKKGTPMHVRAALVYNHILQEKGLTNRFETIKSGEKIKYSFLKLPNPSGSDVIACITSLPKEFNLVEYVDHRRQFEKVFIKPLEAILDTIGWRTEEQLSLEDFLS
jgi:DNA polymerase elongation subunit (family B)